MKKQTLALTFATAILCSGPIAAQSPTVGHAPGGRMSLVVDASQKESYAAHVVITDPETNGVLAHPDLQIAPGQWASAKIDLSSSASFTSASVAVSVSPDGIGAAYFASFVRKDGKTDTESGTLIVSR